MTLSISSLSRKNRLFFDTTMNHCDIPSRDMPRNSDLDRSSMHENHWTWSSAQVSMFKKAMDYKSDGITRQEFADMYSPLIGRSVVTLKRMKLPKNALMARLPCTIDLVAENLLDLVIELKVQPSAFMFRGWLWIFSVFGKEIQLATPIKTRWITEASSLPNQKQGTVKKWLLDTIQDHYNFIITENESINDQSRRRRPDEPRQFDSRSREEEEDEDSMDIDDDDDDDDDAVIQSQGDLLIGELLHSKKAQITGGGGEFDEIASPPPMSSPWWSTNQSSSSSSKTVLSSKSIALAMNRIDGMMYDIKVIKAVLRGLVRPSDDIKDPRPAREKIRDEILQYFNQDSNILSDLVLDSLSDIVSNAKKNRQDDE